LFQAKYSRHSKGSFKQCQRIEIKAVTGINYQRNLKLLREGLGDKS